jgi:hypothetical protein
LLAQFAGRRVSRGRRSPSWSHSFVLIGSCGSLLPVFLARVQLVPLDQRILLVPTRTPVYDLSSGKTALMVGANRSTSKPVAVGRLGNLNRSDMRS